MSVRLLPVAQKLVTAVLLCLMSAACAQNKPAPPRTDPPQGDILPYSIGFTTKGEPVVLGSDATFDSRLLGWLTAPKSLGQTLAETLRYQFGLEVSGSWAFKLVSRAVLPTVLRGMLAPSAADQVAANLGAVAVYLLMAVVLAIRPQGLFPRHA